MKVGDLVEVSWHGLPCDSVGTIVSNKNCDIGFYRVLVRGSVQIMHVDYLEVINEVG